MGGADTATALDFAPDGRLFFAERGGAIKIASGGQVATFTNVATVTTERGGGYSERGLLGLALSPTFATDHFVYAFYSRDDFETQVLVRFTECAGVASDPQTLVTFPSGNDCCHKGGRIKFGSDAKLYVTLGEQHAVTAGSVGRADSIPQDTADLRGKILRYNADGTVPADNPFGATNPVWATGFRNAYGIAFGNGQTFVTSNGPTGDLGLNRGNDLAFVITAGGQYQWPACYGYSHLTPGAASCLDRPEPDWSSESETVVPTGATWVDRPRPRGVRRPLRVLHVQLGHAGVHTRNPARLCHRRTVAMPVRRDPRTRRRALLLRLRHDLPICCVAAPELPSRARARRRRPSPRG